MEWPSDSAPATVDDPIDTFLAQFVRETYILVDRKVVQVPFRVHCAWFDQQYRRGIKRSERHIGYDILRGCEVSTVFLAMHGFLDVRLRGGLFETMVFSPPGRRGNDRATVRYSDYESALAGHRRIVQLVQAGRIRRVTDAARAREYRTIKALNRLRRRTARRAKRAA